MKFFKSVYFYLIIYLMVIFMSSLIFDNTGFLILTGICSILFIITILTDSTNKKTYKEIVDNYNLLLEQKQYDNLIDLLKRYRGKYYVKVLITNLYLYKGDEDNYLILYNKCKSKGILKGYFYRLLHYTNGYYRFLLDDRNLNLTEDSEFPLNNIINLFNDNKFSEVKEKIELLTQFKSDFVNYVTTCIYTMSLEKKGYDTDKSQKELLLLISDNGILKSHYMRHF